jgi:hypothetical protein
VDIFLCYLIDILLVSGYTSSVVAGLWPSLVKSLVLLNTAGQVVPNYKQLAYRKPREKSAIAKGGAEVLLVYLRYLSNRLLKRCYPSRTARVDAWLRAEVMRPVSSDRKTIHFVDLLLESTSYFSAQLFRDNCAN